MSARRTAVLSTAVTALSALALIGAGTAASAGSDAPTPYRVTPAGLELPAGTTFQEHGHVNVVYTSALGTSHRNVHIEGPGTRFADLLGASTLTWDRAGLPDDACITWVQVSGHDEHYGEGGQAPVCRTPAPPAAPPAPPAPAAPPSEAPAPPAAPAAPPAPPASEAAAPAAPAPEATPETPAAETSETVESPAAPTPTPTPTERAEVLATDTPTPTPRPTTAERSEVLAATGARTGALLAGAALALGAGTGLVLWRRRSTARP